ncbi:MAG TPA: penicillin-binding transpeptidase domain-containing protein [Bryobacteraceae bacterium]|nr:penicillin-binding transpeptidase domain-containing protein [Bryobacteraceae bacterium]
MKRLLVPALLLVGLLQNFVVAQTAKPKASASSKSRKVVARRRTPQSPKVDPTAGDNVDGEDLVVRRAAVDALGTERGSIVVADPLTGRVLTMVNQKLALANGFIPCSTIKLVTAVAALSERVVDKDTFIYLGRYASYNLTTALARSNNQYFANLGVRLGFDRVIKYAQMMGLGEKAGLDIAGEQAGEVATVAPKASSMGMLTAFGEGFQVTPLELTAIISAIANGGTLYYLQYPRTQDDLDHFTPQIKRTLDVGPTSLDDIKMGMRGAVDYGTARRVNDPAETILGKTGTCTDSRSGYHMGWFGSYTDTPHKLVAVVMLTSPVKSVSGAVASGVAGAFYRNLAAANYFTVADGKKKSDLPDIITSSPAPPAPVTTSSNSTKGDSNQR